MDTLGVVTLEHSSYIAMSEKGLSSILSLEKQSVLFVPCLQSSLFLSLSLFLSYPKKNMYALALRTMINFYGHEENIRPTEVNSKSHVNL